MSKIAPNQIVAQTVSRAMATDSSGNLTTATTTAAELDFLAGARSAVQTQIDLQAASNARNLNWITNYGVEVDTTGYATYADAAQATPENGTGGSPTCTIARSTTTPLNGVADLNFVKDAANRQGEGFSYDFTIDSAYKGTVQQIAFNYEVLSGTYASGDMTCWIYDVTNAVLLPQPSGNSVISTSIPSQQGQCTFQTAIDSTSYRLIFHVTTTSASAYTLAFDNISVGPQVNASGSVDTVWTDGGVTIVTATTTAPTKATGITVDKMWYRRNGSNLECRVEYKQSNTTSAAAGSGNYLWALPAGLVADTSKVTAYTDVIGAAVFSPTNIIGSGTAAGTNSSIVEVALYDSTRVRLLSVSAAGNGGVGNSWFAMNEASYGVNFYYSVPIAGWGSNNVLSTTANTRAVVFTGTNASQSLTANTTNALFTATKDTVAGWNGSLYTVQVPGDYFAAAAWGNASNTINIYKNGSIYGRGSGTASAVRVAGSWLLPNLVVGDTISFRSDVSITAVNAEGYIHLLQSPQQIAASESINARYYASATSVTGSLATVVWTTKDYDSHNSMASGVYTVPAPGKYRVSADLALSGTFVLNNQNIIEIQKNGTAIKNVTKYVAAAVTNDDIHISDEINCSAGDLIRVQVSSAATGPAIVSSNTKNVFTISRIGN